GSARPGQYAVRPRTRTGSGSAPSSVTGFSGSRTGSGASITSSNRSADRLLRSRTWAATGSPATASKAASGGGGDTQRGARGDREPAEQRHQAGAEARGGRGARGETGQLAVAAAYGVEAAGERTGDRQLGGPGEQVHHLGGQRAARRRQPPFGTPGDGRGERGHGHPGEQQPGGGDGPHARQQPPEESGGRRADQRGGPRGQAEAQVVVLHRVHVGDQPGEQVAT